MDAYETIKKSLGRLFRFSDEQVALFYRMVVPKSYGKNTAVLKQGQVCNFVAIVLSGSLRLFDPETDRTINFFTELDWLADHDSFMRQKPSINVIEAVEDTEIAVISIHNLHKLLEVSPSFIVLAKMLGNLTPSAQQSVYHTPPIDRYNHLMETRPGWIIRFPQKQLASYLGMTPETFSRIKRKTLFS